MKTNLKRLGFLILFSLLIAASFAVKKPTGLHVTQQIIERKGYTLCYDYQHRQAVWVKEVLKAEDLQGKADRKDIIFKEDTSIPEMFRATNEDYQGSKLDRGHLKPAGDSKANQAAMEETFILSNISPQDHQLNSGLWLKLERHVRQLAKDNGSVTVYTGGCYLAEKEGDKKYVKYQVIGERNIAVPNAFFKIAVANGIEAAFILPNEPIKPETPLEAFQTTVRKVEEVAGILFQEMNSR